MRCIFIPTDKVHRSGRTLLKCRRPCCTVKVLANPKKRGVVATCYGWPLPSEVKGWAGDLASATGTPVADYLCLYIRWKSGRIPEYYPPPVPTTRNHKRDGSSKTPEELYGQGVGTEFFKLGSEFGIPIRNSCNCKAMIVMMNSKGVKWCKQNRPSIIKSMEENARVYNWTDYVRAGAVVAFNMRFDIILSVDPIHPIPGMLEVAIRNAEKPR